MQPRTHVFGILAWMALHARIGCEFKNSAEHDPYG